MPATKAKKLSLSSGKDPLVEADEAGGVKATTAVASAGRWRRSPVLPCLVAISVVLLVLLISALTLAYLMASGGGVAGRRLSSLVMGSASGDARFEPLYINLVVNVSAIPACAKQMKDSKLPCLSKDTIIFNADQAIGPLRCLDDAHFESGKGPDNCHGNAFTLNASRSGVVIPETGVYRVHSTVQFADPIQYYVSANIRVDPVDCVADPKCWASPEQRDLHGHTWLSCAVHNSASGAEVGNRFSTCTIDGVRRFSRGDLVSVTSGQAYRGINPFYKSTHIFIYKL